jgi:hypothetical protein
MRRSRSPTELRSTPRVTRYSGPATDFYNLEGGGHELHWLGYKIFAFDLSQLGRSPEDLGRLTGTFSFTDSTGKAQSYDFDLSRFR